MSPAIQVSAARADRRQRLFAFARGRAVHVFAADGSYLPSTEPDGRIAYWYAPALLESTAEDQAWGRRVLERAAGWERFDIFMTASAAVLASRWAEAIGPDLVARCCDHLERFALRERGLAPSAAIYDYQSHGYNDNMPCNAMRILLLGADLLDRADLRDAGMHHLETLATHLERRGLLSEHTSPTYTPIAWAALMDIAEGCRDGDARVLAQACADRVLLGMLAHWHPGSGTSGASTARAYTIDAAQSLSCLNALVWWLCGDARAIDPTRALADAAFPLPIHHARNVAFNTAQFIDLVQAACTGIRPDLQSWLATSRPDTYTVRATSDWSESGAGGSQSCATISHQRPAWWLASSDTTTTGESAGQQLVLNGCLATGSTWQERITFWHKLTDGTPDQGEPTEVIRSPHAGDFAGADLSAFRAEADHVHDLGWYSAVQQGGSALLLGGLGVHVEGKQLTDPRFGVILNTRTAQPDACWRDGQQLDTWEGPAGTWTFLRLGRSFLALRLVGMDHGTALVPRLADRDGYWRLEMPLATGERSWDAATRPWLDLGLCVEMADADEVDFASFRAQVAATQLEFLHGFYRHARYRGRHGELELCDSPRRGTVRFSAIDGHVPERAVFTATGMPSTLADLLPGRRATRRRLLYRDHCRTPFYDLFSHVIANDVTPAPW